MKTKLAWAGGLAICYSFILTPITARAAGLYEPSLLPSISASRSVPSSNVWGGAGAPRLAQIPSGEEVQPDLGSAAPVAPNEFRPYDEGGEAGDAGCSSCNGNPVGSASDCWGAAPVESTGCGVCCGPWYAGLRGLIMTRDRGDNVWLSNSSNYPNQQLLNTHDVAMGYAGGFETYIGRCLNDCWAIEAGYWGLFPQTESADLPYTLGTGPLMTRVDFSALQYNNGLGLTQSVSDWYDNAQLHRVTADYEFHNIELNLVRKIANWGATGGPCAQLQLTAGARYMKIGESLRYSTDYYNQNLGDDPASELHYNIDVDNQLIGFQLGGRYQHALGCRFMAFAGTKAGIYANQIDHHQDITGGFQTAYLTSAAVDPYNINSTKDDVSFLGELDLGLGYQLTQCWRITGGYRAIGITGLAFAPDQIPPSFGYYDYAAQINSSNSMILHGAYAGIECNF
jgi:Putative beta barrel porin-7 (BBP7)